MQQGQLTLFAASNASLTMLQQVLSDDDVDRLQDAFAGRTIYVPKRSGRRIAVEYLRANPRAPMALVIAVCGVSRATYYRARKEAASYGHTNEGPDEATEGRGASSNS